LRRRFIQATHLAWIGPRVILMIGLWASVVAAGAEPLKKVRFQLDWYPDAERGGFISALVNGYYRDAGLDVAILPANPGMSALGPLLSGQTEFAMSQSDMVTISRGQGMGLVSVMATMQHDPQAVMVHDESPVRSFTDLDGRAVAVVPGSSWLLYLVQKFHLTHIREVRATYGISNFLVDPDYIQQVFVTSEPYACLQQGVKVRTLLIKDTGCDPYRVVATTDDVIAHDPGLVQSFVSASIKGWQAYLHDPAATDAEIKRRNPQMTQGLLDFSRKTLIEGHYVFGDADKGEAMGKLDPARLASQYKILRQIHVIPGDFDFTKSYTLRFLPPK
jgi:NitT/TauT family transport system substrate-binding protein